MTTARKRGDLEIHRRLLLEARPYWLHLAGLFALSLATTPFSLMAPLPLKLVLDCVLDAHALPPWLAPLGGGPGELGTLRTLASVAGLVVAIALGKQLLELAFAVLRSYVGERLVMEFRAKLFRHSQALSLTYHDTLGASDSAYRIQYDAPAIQWITVDALIPLLTSSLTLAAMLGVMLRIDWQLASVATCVAPVLFLLSRTFSRRLKLGWRGVKNVESATLSVVQEVLSSVRVVKAFSQEDREQERYVSRARRGVAEQLRLAWIGGCFSLLVALCIAVGTSVVLYIGARHVQTGLITVGDLVLMMSYLAMLYAPLQSITRSAGSLQGSLVSAERAFELLEATPEVQETAQALPVTRAKGAIEFESVSFHYTPDRPALHEVSLSIPQGARVGIAGTTGAGKSTLVSLLLRLYDVSSGRILLDGMDLRRYRLRDLRNQFAIVLQDPVLFSSTILDNIAYGRPEATEEDVIAASRLANAHEFIQRLPKGYATEVGERGVQLSGGERQRISLARAFLKDAPVLILDEPTSSVDVRTEGMILEALERLMHGRTTLMIAHRLATLDSCDIRVQLEGGRILSSTRKTPAATST